jgi:hypothetical protein
MGFDMYTVLPVKKLPEGYEPVFDDMPGYYQLTFSGMFEVVAAMAAAGLLDEEMTAPRLPRWPPRGISQERAEQLQPVVLEPKKLQRRIQPDEVLTIERFLKRRHATTGRRSKRVGKVPAFKFTSNDGWWVRPEECRVVSTVLAETLRDRPKQLRDGLRARGYKRSVPDVEPLVAPWAMYNRLAADHGGYRVW